MVSVITPVYNAEEYLGEYLVSMLRQSYEPFELILVDDGSTDGGEQIIQSFTPRFKARGADLIYIKQEHRGQAAAFNSALPHVRGKYLTWADADDILHPDNLRLRVDYMRVHPGCRFLRCNALHYSQDQGCVLGLAAKEADESTQNVFEALFTGVTYCYAGCYMVETALFRACYPEMRIPESAQGQNLQMLLPAASRELCHYVDQPLMTYRIHANSHSHQRRSLAQIIVRLREFTQLRERVLEYCECDRARYRQLAREIERKATAAEILAARVRMRTKEPVSTGG